MSDGPIKRRFAISFRWRAILILTLIVAALQVIATGRIVLRQNAAMEEIEHTKGDLLAEIAARSMHESLRIQDPVQTIRNLEVLRSDPYFAGARVLGADGTLIAETYPDSSVDLSDVQHHRIDIEVKSPLGEPRKMQVVIVRSLAGLRAQQQTLAQAKLINLVVFTIAIAGTLMLITGTIMRPLAQIRASIGRIRDGELSYAIPNLNRDDQVGEVARALELFRTNAIEMRAVREGHELRARQDRHRILRALEATQDAILILAANGQVEFANPRAQKFFQHTSKSQALLFANVTDHAHRQQIEAAIRDRHVLDLTTEINLPADDDDTADARTLLDENLPVSMRINPIMDGDGSGIGTVIVISDNSFQERIASRIQRLADFDSLTGLYNRRVLEERLEQQLIADPRRTALLLLDLDRFKTINDTLGHPVGDELLMHIATLLRENTAKGDLAARMGGDEFAILIAGANAPERAVDVADRIVKALGRPVRLEQRVLQTGASIGIAIDPLDSDSAQDLVRKADLALYAAKHQGRGRAILFENQMEQVVQRKSNLEEALRRALANQRITAHFQCQTALKDGALVGFEALARWDDETLGPVSPGEFVPVAEETGLIRELTVQMLQIACRFAVTCRSKGFAGRVSVNISPHLFSDNLTELIQDSLLINNCPAEALVVEITEAVFLSQGKDAKEQILALQKMGVLVALDDFGMGFSSLSYLQHFPVNNIKIDRAFVSRVTESAETGAIVSAIVKLGHALNMTVTAEGVETKEQRTALRLSGADTVQGYIDGKPMPAKAALDLLDQISDTSAARRA